jgi:hypothetical protein
MFPRHKTTNHGYQCTLRILGILIVFNFVISSQLLVLNINIILIL